MSICYIVGAGEFYGSFTPEKGDFVIAADGGYASLKERNIRCDLLVGDLDSLTDAPTDVSTLTHPVEKDETDMHLSYLEGKKRGYSKFRIYGGVGGRADHTFANYCLLSYIKKDGGDAVLCGDGYEALVIENEVTRVAGTPGYTVSVFAFGGVARGVSIRGLYYTLNDGALTPSFPLGVSNHFTEEDCEIEVKEGTLLVIRQI